ncbi:MAG: hypothetical protein ACREF3_20880 [Acetobacteraceae bacterium]
MDAAMRDSMTQMGNAAKGAVHTFVDLSVQAMQQFQKLTEQNIVLYTGMQDALLKNALQIQDTNLKLWAAMPVGNWLNGTNGTGAARH